MYVCMLELLKNVGYFGAILISHIDNIEIQSAQR